MKHDKDERETLIISTGGPTGDDQEGLAPAIESEEEADQNLQEDEV